MRDAWSTRMSRSTRQLEPACRLGRETLMTALVPGIVFSFLPCSVVASLEVSRHLASVCPTLKKITLEQVHQDPLAVVAAGHANNNGPSLRSLGPVCHSSRCCRPQDLMPSIFGNIRIRDFQSLCRFAWSITATDTASDFPVAE